MGVSSGPLSGYLVVDFSTALAAPRAASMLGDLGADVIKVEAPGGDLLRRSQPRIGDISAMFHLSNRGKRGIVLDLKTEEGRSAAGQLAARADVVIQNFRPSVATRLGISYEQLRALNEHVIVVAVSGFGSHGPDAERAAFDSVIQAESGLCAVEADGDGHPRFTSHTIVVKLTAMSAAQAAVAALLARERGHGGQLVEVPMLDVAVEFLWSDVSGRQTLLDVPDDGSPSDASISGARSFIRLADGWCSISFGREADRARACAALGVTSESATPEEVVEAIKAAARPLTREEITARFRTADVPFGVVRTVAELPHHPQLVSAGLFQETAQPEVGRIRQPRPAPRFSAYARPEPGVSPHVGEHTDEVSAWIQHGAAPAPPRQRTTP